MGSAHLYVLGEAGVPDGPVKIGLHYGTPTGIGRAGLSTGNWRALKVLHHHPMPNELVRWTEYVIHGHLKPWHVRGEWFGVRHLLTPPGDWAQFLDLAAAQGVPGGSSVTVGTSAHHLTRIRVLRWQPPRELVAECSCGHELIATKTTLPALAKRFESEHVSPFGPTLHVEAVRAFVDVVNADLAGSYTATGITRWWARPRHELGGRSPGSFLDTSFNTEGDAANTIRRLAAALIGPGDAT